MACVMYASAIGSLIYVIICTRLDFSQTVSMVILYMVNSGKEQQLLVKHIFRYLKGTSDVGFIYKGNIGCTLLAYSYLEHVGDLHARRSITSYAFTIEIFL